jgi:exodeoxyribonuclease VII small subunit
VSPAKPGAKAATDEELANLKFEDALARLEAVVARLEGGDLPLEESLGLFEEGVRLTRHCSKRLTEAERKVTILLKNAQGQIEEKPFEPDNTGLRTEA